MAYRVTSRLWRLHANKQHCKWDEQGSGNDQECSEKTESRETKFEDSILRNMVILGVSCSNAAVMNIGELEWNKCRKNSLMMKVF